MTVTAFSLVDNQTYLPADIVDDHIYVSADQSNGTGSDKSSSIRAVVDYHDLQSTDGTVELQALVEGKSVDGTYYPIAYQFEPFQLTGFEQSRSIVMQPDMFWFDAGIDNIVFIGNTTVQQVSNQTGILTDTWRFCVRITDPNNTFTSVRMSIFGERYGNI